MIAVMWDLGKVEKDEEKRENEQIINISLQL